MRYSDIIEAAPTPEIQSKFYFHGTPDTRSADAIMKDGLQGRDRQGRVHLAPVSGMVYLTPHIDYAIIYALGGNFQSQMLEKKDFADPYGYVFVLEGRDLVDVQPDEDSVGEWLSSHSEPILVPWKRPDNTIAMNGEKPYMRTSGYVCKAAMGSPDYRIWQFIRDNMTDGQFEKAMDGEVSAQAAGGKRALKKMPDWMKIHLINAGAHVAHNGSIKPSQCWRILKADKMKLRKDGSNFLSVAERIA
jgi:hypothetical protein